MAKLLSGTRIYGNLLIDTNVAILGSNISSNTTTGALTVAGGVGIAGNVFAGNVSASGFFYANGSPFVSSSYGNATVASYLPTYTGSLAASADIVTLTANAGAQSNQITGANAAIVTANTALKAYTDAQITTTQSWVTGANAAIVTANSAVVSYVNTLNTAMSSNVAGANVNISALQANTGSFYAYANTKIGTNTNSNLVVVATTTSTSTTTGALVVAGGAGISGNLTTANVYATGVYIGAGSAISGLFWSANNAAFSVVSTSSGAGNLTISGTSINLTAVGPGAVTTGNSTAIPVITTDAYGRISSISTSTVSTTISLAGTSGTGSVSGGGTLTFASTNGITATASGSTITISSPQDLQTTALPTFANVTVANIIINTGAKRNGRNIVTNYSGNTAPATPLAGDEWFRGNTGVLYKYVFDNVTSTNNWIDISSALYNANTAAVANTIALRDSGGNLTATNFLGIASSAKYADLAEMYTADDAYGPATLVVFGGAAEITVTTESHDPRVAGVISTNPAYLMNSELPNGLPVAFTGRVPCLVQGPVDKGDLLVTSATPGVAQRLDNSLFKPGCVVGKSLGTIQNDDIATIEVAVGRY